MIKKAGKRYLNDFYVRLSLILVITVTMIILILVAGNQISVKVSYSKEASYVLSGLLLVCLIVLIRPLVLRMSEDIANRRKFWEKRRIERALEKKKREAERLRLREEKREVREEKRKTRLLERKRRKEERLRHIEEIKRMKEEAKKKRLMEKKKRREEKLRLKEEKEKKKEVEERKILLEKQRKKAEKLRLEEEKRKKKEEEERRKWIEKKKRKAERLGLIEGKERKEGIFSKLFKKEKKKLKPAVGSLKEEIKKIPIVKELSKSLKIEVGKYETDIDVLYKIIEKTGRIKLSALAEYFGVDRKKMEEWATILQDHNLAEIHYPAIGGPELRRIVNENGRSR